MLCRARPGRAAGAVATRRTGRRPSRPSRWRSARRRPTSITVVATSTSMSPAAKAVIAASFSSARQPAVQDRDAQTPASGPARSMAATSIDAAAGRRALVVARRPLLGRRRRQLGVLGLVAGPSPPMRGQTTYAWRPSATSSRMRCQAAVQPGRLLAAGTTEVEIGDAAARAVRPASRSPGRRRRSWRRCAESASPSSPAGAAAVRPCSRRASRCSTPKRCCSSTTTRPRSAKLHTAPGCSAWVPTTMPACAAAASSSACLRARPRAATRSAGRRGSRASSAPRRPPCANGPSSASIERACCGGQHLGGREQRRLPAGVDDLQHRPQGHDRLARADLALQQPVHRCVAARARRQIVRPTSR